MKTNALPQEAERLLALEPGGFVAERDRLVRELRDENRPDEAAAVAGLRKPTPVVFAVNRAARDRPNAARDASEAALRVKERQVGNQPEDFKQALGDLDAALDLLSEVAVAHVAPPGKASTDAMRRRVRDLLRSAVADDDGREALVRGALTEELETVGFSSYAGVASASPQQPKKRSGQSRMEQQIAKRRQREKALRVELAEAEERLRSAATAVREAERERKAAERAVRSLRSKLEVD